MARTRRPCYAGRPIRSSRQPIPLRQLGSARTAFVQEACDRSLLEARSCGAWEDLNCRLTLINARSKPTELQPNAYPIRIGSLLARKPARAGGQHKRKTPGGVFVREK